MVFIISWDGTEIRHFYQKLSLVAQGFLSLHSSPLRMEFTRIIVHGRVHGVWYRATTKQVADKLGLRGFVRNLRDGTVEIVVAGEKLEELIKWCHLGPPLADVKTVTTTKVELDRDFNSFEIQY